MFGRKANLSRPCCVRVYEYGCLSPIQGEKELVDTIFKRNQLWNKLVEIDRAFEEKYSGLIERNGAGSRKQEIEFLRDLVDAFRGEIRQLRQKARSGKAELPRQLQQDFDCVKSCLQEKRAEYKEMKKRVREESKDMLDALEAERKEAIKKALHSFGLWWCNWNEEHVEYETARKRALQERAKGKPASLQFHRFDGSGKATARLRENGMSGAWGMPVKNVFRPNNTFWIEPVPVEAWEHPVRAVRRKSAQTRVYFRVDSVGREPVWAVLPMVMHRSLPEGGLIRQASLVRERVGRTFRYKLVVTVELPGNNRVRLIRNGAVAVDIGWRRLKDGIRVAYWVDEKGRKDEDGVLLPLKMFDAFLKLRDLRSIRDKHFDEAKKVLVEFLERVDAPDWLREKTQNIKQWRSQAKLIALLEEWRDNRFFGDKGVFTWLENWRERENHIYDWESNLRDQVLRWRREEYRKFAKQLATNYDKVILEDFDLRKVAEKPNPEDGTQGSIPPDYQRYISAPSELRLSIVNACSRDGVEVVRVPAALTTLRCHSCGYTERFDAAKQVWHTCPKCGALWDQDYNACINLLLSGGVLPDTLSQTG